MSPKKVWVVIYQDGPEPFFIEGVFDEEEKAETFVASQDAYARERIHIEECEVL